MISEQRYRSLVSQRRSVALLTGRPLTLQYYASPSKVLVYETWEWYIAKEIFTSIPILDIGNSFQVWKPGASVGGMKSAIDSVLSSIFGAYYFPADIPDVPSGSYPPWPE